MDGSTYNGFTPAPFINNWLVCGTFENDADNAGHLRDWTGEESIAPGAGI